MEVDHAVTLIGFDTENGDEPFFTVRNSWGSSWGEGGYARLGMASGKGICGMNQWVAYPEIEAFG